MSTRSINRSSLPSPRWQSLVLICAGCLLVGITTQALAQRALNPAATKRAEAGTQTVKHSNKVASGQNPVIVPAEEIYVEPAGCFDGNCGGGSCGGSCGSSNCNTAAFSFGMNSLFPTTHRGFWVRAEALSWWLNGFDTPPLVTTSVGGTSRDDAGVPGQASTSVLYGNESVNEDAAAGGRYAIGTWLNPCRDIGLEFNFFHTESDGESFVADSTTAGIVARPFFNVTENEQDAELIVFPNVVTGSLRIQADSEFSGGELIIQRAWGDGCHSRVIGLFGYRFQHLEESLRFTQATTSIDTSSPVQPGTTFDLVDQFRTENEFHGAELGLMTELCHCDRVSFELLAKIAIGNTHTRTSINGSTRIVTPGGSDSTNEGALLALPSNIGTFEEDNFSVVPEITLRMNYQLAANLQLQFGYTFIYWSDVARVGSAINPNLNLTQLPPGPQSGANLPAFTASSEDFWAQGLNLGLQYDF